MKKLLMFAVMSLAACATPAVLADPVVSSVDVEQAAALQSRGALLLDVREPQEFAEVHAKGAILIPLAQLPSRLNEIAQYKDQTVVVICRSGRRSAQGAQILRDAGFRNVVNVTGGTNAWVSAGLPVVRR